MKKTVVFGMAAVMLMLGGVFQLQAQSEIGLNLAPLENDFTTLFDGIGKEVVPYLQQTALSGNVVGEAGFGKAHFSLTLAAVGVTFSDGIGRFINDDNTDWQFQLVSIPEILDTAVGDNEYYQLTQRQFAYPSIRLGIGFKLFGGFELLANGFYVPKAAVDFGLGKLPAEAGGIVNDIGPTLNIINAGGLLRKVLISEKKHSMRPAVSLGVGYTYSAFELGVDSFALSTFMDELPEVPGYGPLDLSGSFKLSTSVQTAGMELHISKRLLLLTPFVKLGTWYQYSRFAANATLMASVDGETQDYSLDLNVDTESIVSDVSILTTAGCEVKLLFLIFSPSVTVNLQDPDFEFTDISLDGFRLKNVTANLGFRIQL